MLWVVLVDPSGSGDWPEGRVFGPFTRRADAELAAFDMNERLGDDLVAKAVEVQQPAASE